MRSTALRGASGHSSMEPNRVEEKEEHAAPHSAFQKYLLARNQASSLFMNDVQLRFKFRFFFENLSMDSRHCPACAA